MLTTLIFQSGDAGRGGLFLGGGRGRPFVRDNVALTFLIVEDDALIALDLRSIVAQQGGEVIGIADTAADAEHVAQSFRPDVILMDVRLRGEEDGIAAAAALTRKLRSVVVFVTGNTDPDTAARILTVSSVPPVEKPVDPRVLVRAVLNSLRDRPSGEGDAH